MRGACCAWLDESAQIEVLPPRLNSPVHAVNEQEVEWLPQTGEPLKKNITLKRGTAQEPWGLQVENVAARPVLLVTEVRQGAAEDFNKLASSADFQFQKFDCILGINGKSSASEMMQAFANSDLSLDLSIERPRTIAETLKKDEGALGLALQNTETGIALSVTNISDTGIVKSTNANVRIGDLILAVNEQMGTGKYLSKIIQFSMTLQVVILRLESQN